MNQILAKQVLHFWAQPVNDPKSVTVALLAELLAEPETQAGMLAALTGDRRDA